MKIKTPAPIRVSLISIPGKCHNCKDNVYYGRQITIGDDNIYICTYCSRLFVQSLLEDIMMFSTDDKGLIQIARSIARELD